MIDATRLECRTGGSDKFYQLLSDGLVAVLHWGRNGTRGQFKADPHPKPFHLIVSERRQRGYQESVELVRFDGGRCWQAVSDAALGGDTPSAAQFDALADRYVAALAATWAQRAVAVAPADPASGTAVAVLVCDWARTTRVRRDLEGVAARLGDPVAVDEHADRALFALAESHALVSLWPAPVAAVAPGPFDAAAASVALGLLDTFPGTVAAQLDAAFAAAQMITAEG